MSANERSSNRWALEMGATRRPTSDDEKTLRARERVVIDAARRLIAVHRSSAPKNGAEIQKYADGLASLDAAVTALDGKVT
jgi:hypothetical protein